MNKKFDEKIEKFDKRVIHLIWTIFISMITSAVTVFLATGSIK